MHKYLVDLKKIAESRGGQLISTEYTNCHAEYEFIDELGNRFKARGYSIKNGRWSPQTAQARKAKSLTKYKISDLQKFAETKGGSCLSTEYINDKSPYLWEDSQKRQFTMEWYRVIAGQWSPYEKSETLSKLRTKYTIEDLKNFAISKGGECLSTVYTRLDDEYEWKDRNGNVFCRTWSQIKVVGDVLYGQGASKQETEVADFISNLGINVVRNSRKILDGLELDVFLPELNIAIEYNGCKWHTEIEGGKDKNYHLSKLLDCQKRGIDLIHIFDYEWVERKEQVMSFLRSKLGKNSRYIYARKCELREVEKRQAKQFLSDYHIQGSCNFHKAFGLYYKNELLSILTVGKHHRNNKDWVLSRFVGKTDVTVVGGLSRLTKAALVEFDTLTTWVDRRWSSGISWINLGWSLENTLSPDYFYYQHSTKKVISKQSRKKSTAGTPESMTEWEHAKLDGLDRVWDCGKLKLVYRNKSQY